jgi:hypothetical protein
VFTLTLALLAAATPPPLQPVATPAPRASGFDRLYVDPAAFGASVRPTDSPPPPPPRPLTTLTLKLDTAAIDAADLDVEAIQTAIAEWEGVTGVRLDTDGTALVWHAPSPRIPQQDLHGHPLDDLGEIRAFPPSWTPRPPPPPPRLADLVIDNDTLVRVEVEVQATRIGALLPQTTGTLHSVRAGTYAVVLVTPDGFSHPRDQRTITPARAPAPAPAAPRRP